MKVYWLAVLIPVFLLTTALGAQGSQGEVFSFNALRFGSVPAPGMICTGGFCPDRELPPQKIPYSTFKFPVDTNFLGAVPISTPDYDFSREGFFRMRFRLLCPRDQVEACVQRTSTNLQELFGFRFSSPLWEMNRGWYMVGEDGRGNRATITQESDVHPSVSIQNVQLMENLRHEANPNYEPKGFP